MNYNSIGVEYRTIRSSNAWMAEWLKAAVSKTVDGVYHPQVKILFQAPREINGDAGNEFPILFYLGGKVE